MFENAAMSHSHFELPDVSPSPSERVPDNKPIEGSHGQDPLQVTEAGKQYVPVSHAIQLSTASPKWPAVQWQAELPARELE